MNKKKLLQTLFQMNILIKSKQKDKKETSNET